MQKKAAISEPSHLMSSSASAWRVPVAVPADEWVPPAATERRSGLCFDANLKDNPRIGLPCAE